MVLALILPPIALEGAFISVCASGAAMLGANVGREVLAPMLPEWMREPVELAPPGSREAALEKVRRMAEAGGGGSIGRAGPGSGDGGNVATTDVV